MNNKNMRLWIIGICVALIIIIVAAAAAMNKKSDSGQETGTTSESGVTADSNASMGSGSPGQFHVRQPHGPLFPWRPGSRYR